MHSYAWSGGPCYGADEPFAALVTSAWTTPAYGYPDRLDHNLSAGEGDAGNVLHDGAGEVQLDALPVPLIVAPLTLLKLNSREVV